jgi:lactate permease
LVVPVFAAVAGFLTGTGAAANAMLMPMVTALSAQAGVSVPWMAAVQATVSTNLTLLSPMRVAMGIAFDEGRTSEAALYRAARVLAGPALLAGAAAVVLLVWAPD